MKGKVAVSPPNASLPTKCPMNALSTILYSELAIIAMMAGKA